MKASKIGVLQTVVDDQVQIDNNWYNGANIKQYLPKEMDIQVEYNEDGNGNLIFVRAQTAFTPKKTGKQFGERKGGYTPSKAPYVDRSVSIIKQTLMKVTGFILANREYSTEEEALEAVEKVYQALKEKYLKDLKSN